MKNLLKIGIVCLVFIAALSSCTYGEADGSGGDLVIAGIPDIYVSPNTSPFYVKITTANYAFKPAEYQKITDTVVRATLYQDGAKYTGTESKTLSFEIYNAPNNSSPAVATLNNKSIAFNNGGGYVKWVP